MGVVDDELPRVAAMIRATPRLRVDALYTHYASADDESDPFIATQSAKFDAMVRELGIDAPLHHMANSAATMRGMVRPGDYVRCGIALFGCSSAVSRHLRSSGLRAAERGEGGRRAGE